MLNAGQKLWNVQRKQKTGLCIGLDPHFEAEGVLNKEFYTQYVSGRRALLETYFQTLAKVGESIHSPVGADAPYFLAGLTAYFLDIIEVAWDAGIRVYKPQIAFYERFAPFGTTVLEILCRDLHVRSEKSGEDIFLILDAKRGDIESTQYPYYASYLSRSNEEVFPGVAGRFGFDTMTVTTWMGTDVLTPGLPFFKNGRGAIVVTRSSNPSGTTIQDVYIEENTGVELSEKQKSFAVSGEEIKKIEGIIGRKPTAHEFMLYQTEEFSKKNDLNTDGISPIFSVMGSTVKMTDTFRKIRPHGIALVPGFGAQGGSFENVMPLHISSGPLAGHIGILSSSRDFNYPWMEKAGGAGDPKNLAFEMSRAVAAFRAQEKEAYLKAGLLYPFS